MLLKKMSTESQMPKKDTPQPILTNYLNTKIITMSKWAKLMKKVTN